MTKKGSVHTKGGSFKKVYGDDEWFTAAYAYLLYHSMKRVSKETGIPYQTLQSWKNDHESKWAYWTDKAQKKMMGKTLPRLNAMLEKAIAVQEKNLTEGEERVTTKGAVIRVRPNVAATNAAMGTILDKIHRITGNDGPKRKEPPKKSKKDLKWELAQYGEMDDSPPEKDEKVQ